MQSDDDGVEEITFGIDRGETSSDADRKLMEQWLTDELDSLLSIAEALRRKAGDLEVSNSKMKAEKAQLERELAFARGKRNNGGGITYEREELELLRKQLNTAEDRSLAAEEKLRELMRFMNEGTLNDMKLKEIDFQNNEEDELRFGDRANSQRVIARAENFKREWSVEQDFASLDEELSIEKESPCENNADELDSEAKMTTALEASEKAREALQAEVERLRSQMQIQDITESNVLNEKIIDTMEGALTRRNEELQATKEKLALKDQDLKHANERIRSLQVDLRSATTKAEYLRHRDMDDVPLNRGFNEFN